MPRAGRDLTTQGVTTQGENVARERERERERQREREREREREGEGERRIA